MQEVFEKIIKKLNERFEHYDIRNKILTDAGMFSDADRMADRMIELNFAREIIKQEAAEYNNGWIPADEPPEDDDYILLSFDNFDELLIGRYDTDEEGNGAYYLGDCCEEDTCVANNMFVNAWQPLPEEYKEGDRE